MNMTVPPQRTVVVDRTIALEDAGAIAAGRARLTLSEAARERCGAGFERLQRVIAERRHVYGVTTGFGPLANRLIDSQDSETLQQNLIYHLASGVGPPFSWTSARAIVLARIMALVQGASGIRPETLGHLVALLNSDLAPEVPARGTVGASGDLTPLAHVVLCLQGMGRFIDPQSCSIPACEALEKMRLPPLDLSHRDGLALVNGTSAMTGVGVLNSLRIERALEWAAVLSSGMAQVLRGRMEAWDPSFAELRPHSGQHRATAELAAAVQGARRIDAVPLATRRLGPRVGVETSARAGQDAYTIRCAPQVIGAVWDSAGWHRRIIETELHAVTDNPVFPQDAAVPALHGGNFMGLHVALASDALAVSATVLGGFHERQIARITDEKLNDGLPAFLTGGPAGLTSGLMGAQVTATALLAEMRSTGPASVHSISTNGANQDVVSQGTIAARLVADKLDHLFRIQAILAIAVAQAIDLADQAGVPGDISESALKLRAIVRRTSAFLDTDRPLGAEIDALARRMEETEPPLPARDTKT